MPQLPMVDPSFPVTELEPLTQQAEGIGSQDRALAALSAARASLARAARAVVVCLALAPAIAAAQQIGGTVTDATGAVLPGVTVEARSPALIEQVRTAVTDGNGQYLIVALETGAYTVTYRLPGFGVVVREGIELNSGFAATVDVRLAVGGLAETITVSEARPLVDIQNVVQRAVMDREVIDSIPTGKSLVSYGLLVPGMVGAESYGTSLAQDSGGLTSQTMQRMSIHGGSRHDQLLHLNGLDVGDAWTQGASLAYFPDTNFEEISFDYSANGADVETGGVVVNMIPREGGNRFSGSTFATFTFPALHADNLDQALIDRGLPSGTLVDENWTVSPSVGGPLVRDRLWFFLTHTRQRADLKAPGVFEAVDPRALVFEPDPARPTVDEALVTEQSINFTLQPTARDKFKAYWTNSATDRPRQLQGRTLGSVFITPDAAGAAQVRTNVYQAAWVRPHTNRLLFEAGASRQPIRLVFGPSATAVTELPGVFEVAPFRASRNTSGWLSGPTSRQSPKNIQSYRASLSYVTGSHNLKVGATLLQQRIAVSGGERRQLALALDPARRPVPRDLLGHVRFGELREPDARGLRAGAVDARPADRQRRSALGLREGRLSRPGASHERLGAADFHHSGRRRRVLEGPSAAARAGLRPAGRRPHRRQALRQPLRRAGVLRLGRARESGGEQPPAGPVVERRRDLPRRRRLHPGRRSAAGRPDRPRAQRRAVEPQRQPGVRRAPDHARLRSGMGVRVGQPAVELGVRGEPAARAGRRPVARRRLLPPQPGQPQRTGRPCGRPRRFRRRLGHGSGGPAAAGRRRDAALLRSQAGLGAASRPDADERRRLRRRTGDLARRGRHPGRPSGGVAAAGRREHGTGLARLLRRPGRPAGADVALPGSDGPVAVRGRRRDPAGITAGRTTTG